MYEKKKLGQNQLRQIKESLEFKFFLIFCTKKPADIYHDGKLPLAFFFMLGFVLAFLAIKKFEVVLSALIRKCAEKINHVNQLASFPPSAASHYKSPVKLLLP